MPYVTQQRRHPSEPRGRVYRDGALRTDFAVGDLLAAYRTSEDTTSFRTGRGVAGVPDADEEALFKVKSYAESFGAR